MSLAGKLAGLYAGLVLAFYRRTAFSLLFFAANFAFFYLPLYPRLFELLSFFGEKFPFYVVLGSALGLLLTVPMLSKNFKETLFQKKKSRLSFLYLGFWGLCLFYLLVLDAAAIAIGLMDAFEIVFSFP